MNTVIYQVVGDSFVPATVPITEAQAESEIAQLRAENPDVEFFSVTNLHMSL